MAERILCSLEIVGDGMPYRGSRLEARARWWGFSVWFRDEHLCRCGKEIGRSYGRYDACKLAAIILDYDIAWKLFGSCPCDPEPAVLVTGEGGLRAQLLRGAFTRGVLGCGWLMDQSAASFNALDRLIGDAPHDGWRDVLLHTRGSATELALELDFPALLRRYGLATPDATLGDLYEAMRRDSSGREMAERKRRDAVVPWADQINLMSRALGISFLPARSMEMVIISAKRIALERHLESYALEHRQLPTGTVKLHYDASSVFRSASGYFDVDIEKLAAMIARDCARLDVPATYRMPRRQRKPHFSAQIEALVSAFNERLIVASGARRENDTHFRRQWRLRNFLEDYVEDYERLPRGRVRVATTQLPVPEHAFHDLGEVDFDALRQAAGLADEN